MAQGMVWSAPPKPAMYMERSASGSGRELSISTITPSALRTRIFQRKSKRACPGVPKMRMRSPLSSVSTPKSRPTVVRSLSIVRSELCTSVTMGGNSLTHPIAVVLPAPTVPVNKILYSAMALKALADDGCR